MPFYDFIISDLTLLIPCIIAFIVLLIGSYTDLKTREVPDWVNFGLIAIGFGINILFSIIYWKMNFIVNSMIGFGIFFAIAWIMFHTGQWGGGDSKMLMGLGSLIGIDVFSKSFPFLASFLINILIVGALYGIAWSIALIFRNRRAFSRAFARMLKEKKIAMARKMVFMFFIAMVLLAFIPKDTLARMMMLYAAVISALTFYLWLSVRAVEDSCMLKYVSPEKLTEGDWIAKDIKIGCKYIAGPKDLGIEKKQIKKLMELYKKRKVKKVLIKEGIPFVPSFLIAFILTIIFGNLMFIIFY